MLKRVFRRGIPEEDGKLFPATAERLATTFDLGQTRGHQTQHLIAGIVAVGVDHFKRFNVATAALILTGSLIETSYVLAYHDELTGIRGRRAFNQALQSLDQQYAIAIVDIGTLSIAMGYAECGHDVDVNRATPLEKVFPRSESRLI